MANTFSVDNVGNFEPVAADTVCRRIRIFQNGKAGNSDYLVSLKADGSDPIRRAANEEHDFICSRYFNVGEIAGYVALVDAGTETFAKVEQDL